MCRSLGPLGKEVCSLLVNIQTVRLLGIATNLVSEWRKTGDSDGILPSVCLQFILSVCYLEVIA